MSEDKDLNTFFLAFVGQQVIITTNLEYSTVFESPEASTTETQPVFYEGILLDYDAEYYYLGNTPDEITQAVKRTNAVHIMVQDDKAVYDAILDQMPDPSNMDEVN